MSFQRAWLPSWPEYAMQQGLELRGHGVERRARCPIHGGERDSLCVNVETGAWHCHSCHAGGSDVLAFHRQWHGLSFIEAAKELRAWDEDGERQQRPGSARNRPMATISRPAEACGTSKYAKRAWALSEARRIWPLTRAIAGSDGPAERYLQLERCCPLPPADSDLRWIDELHLFGFCGPALVGRMSLATDHRRGHGLHITWLRQDGSTWRRAERRYLGRKAGCVIRLWPDEAVSTGLGIGEGIESSLSLAHAFTPVWAAMDAGNLSALPVLEAIEALVIGADHDDAGLKAATTCADRWAAAGVEVHIVAPSTERHDWNDHEGASA